MKKIILCSISGLLVSFICFASNADQVCPTIVWPTGHSDQNNGSWYAEGYRYGNCYYITCCNNGNTENSDFRQSIMDVYSSLWQQYGDDNDSGNAPKDQFMSGIRAAAKSLQQNFDKGYTSFPSKVSLPVPAKPFPTGFDLYDRGYRDGLIYMMAGAEADTIASDCKSFALDLPARPSIENDEYIKGIHDVCPELENKMAEAASYVFWPTGHSDQNDGSWCKEGYRYGNCYYITCYNNSNTESLDFRQSIMDEYSNLWQQYGDDNGSGNAPKDQFMSGIRNVANALQQDFDNGYTSCPSGVSFPVLDKPFPMGFGMYARGYRDAMIYNMLKAELREDEAVNILNDCASFYYDLYGQGNPVWSDWTKGWITDGLSLLDDGTTSYSWYRLKLSSDQRDEYRKGIHYACPDLENKIVEADKDKRGCQHHVMESSDVDFINPPSAEDTGTRFYPVSGNPSWDAYTPTY